MAGVWDLVTFVDQLNAGCIYSLYQGNVLGVTLGTIDGDPEIEIEKHIFVGSKAPWDHIGGPALQFEEWR